jgi:hypothetical protein
MMSGEVVLAAAAVLVTFGSVLRGIFRLSPGQGRDLAPVRVRVRTETLRRR